MALDVQRNWDVAMAENLERLTIRGRERHTQNDIEERAQCPTPPRLGPPRENTTTSEPVYLPDEILVQILSYISAWRTTTDQPTLAACCQISHQWYRTSTPLLYRSPRLYGHNFSPFVLSICPSKNLSVRESRLASLVRVLDMSALVHQANKSTTARLLGRTKGNLEVFIAPVRGFAMNAFPALSKAHNLHTLDLSLVSESPPLPDLFKTLQHLSSLRTFRLPRSAGFGIHHAAASFPWPANLENLSLSGGIDAHFLHGVVSFPPNLKSLTIEHCPSAKGYAVTHLLRRAVAPLKGLRKLRIAHMPRLSDKSLDGVLFLLPQLEELSISVDYITEALFDEGHLNHIKDPLIVPAGGAPGFPPPWDSDTEESSPVATPPPPPVPQLRVLELTYSGTPADITDKVSPLDILIAIDDGVLPRLRQVRVATSLMWQEAEAESLSDVLVEMAVDEEGEDEGLEGVDGGARGSGRAKGREVEAGVWRFEG